MKVRATGDIIISGVVDGAGTRRGRHFASAAAVSPRRTFAGGSVSVRFVGECVGHGGNDHRH